MPKNNSDALHWEENKIVTESHCHTFLPVIKLNKNSMDTSWQWKISKRRTSLNQDREVELEEEILSLVNTPIISSQATVATEFYCRICWYKYYIFMCSSTLQLLHFMLETGFEEERKHRCYSKNSQYLAQIYIISVSKRICYVYPF